MTKQQKLSRHRGKDQKLTNIEINRKKVLLYAKWARGSPPLHFSSFLLFRAKQNIFIFPFCGLTLTWKYISIKFRRVCLISFFAVHPCQDFPLDHCGIISLAGHPRGEVAVPRRYLLRKEGLTRSCCPALPSTGPAASTETAHSV